VPVFKGELLDFGFREATSLDLNRIAARLKKRKFKIAAGIRRSRVPDVGLNIDVAAVAPGNAAPEGSVTFPKTDPPPIWAPAGVENASSRAAPAAICDGMSMPPLSPLLCILH